MTNYIFCINFIGCFKINKFPLHLSVLHYLWEKLKIREILKVLKKTELSRIVLQGNESHNFKLLFFKKHVIEAKRAQELPLGQAHALVLTGIQVGVHTSLKVLDLELK